MSGELERWFEKLSRLESPRLPIISLYLNLYPERTDPRSLDPRLGNLLRPLEQAADSGSLDHDASKSLRDGVQQVLNMTSGFETMVEPAVAVFVGGDMEMTERRGLPRRVWECAVAGPAPYLRPLQGMLDESRKVATVVLDSRSAEITVSHTGEVLGQQRIEAEEVVRKSNYAGWYGLDEHRNRQRAEEIRNQLFREVADRLERLRRDQAVELVFVGGHRDATEAFTGFLDPRVRAITETFVVDLHTLTPALLAATIAGLEEDYELRQEARLVDEVYARAAAGDLAAVGLDRVLVAANRNAVSQLLIHDGVVVPGAVCPQCSALSDDQTDCEQCESPTVPVPDLIEALARSVVEAGGSVEHVMADTRLAPDLVAATLRYEVW
jgi:peptide subunit release factor 1 (eRF1)